MTQTQSERRAYYDALLRDAIAEQIVARHAEIAVTRARPGSRSMGRSGMKVTVFILIAAIGVVLLAAIGARYYWRRAFREEVIIEDLRIWRYFIIEDYRRRHPEEAPSMSVAEEAIYMAMHSKHRKRIYAEAWRTVRSGRRWP